MRPRRKLPGFTFSATPGGSFHRQRLARTLGAAMQPVRALGLLSSWSIGRGNGRRGTGTGFTPAGKACDHGSGSRGAFRRRYRLPFSSRSGCVLRRFQPAWLGIDAKHRSLTDPAWSA